MSQTADILRKRLGALKPRTAIVLGSSLGGIGDAVEVQVTIPYDVLPEFPRPTVSGHAGELVAGRLGGEPVLVLKGRAHAYEKGDPQAMRGTIRALSEIGIETLLLTNAAGSLVTSVGPGCLMLITDHINLSGMNPLFGEEGDERFVPMTEAYDPLLANGLRQAAVAERIDLAEGVYAWFSGPSFETPAEIRMARILSADAIGMSTVPETILARRYGLRVAAVSVITNLGAGLGGGAPSHAETKTEGAKAAGDMMRLLRRFMMEHGT